MSSVRRVCIEWIQRTRGWSSDYSLGPVLDDNEDHNDDQNKQHYDPDNNAPRNH